MEKCGSPRLGNVGWTGTFDTLTAASEVRHAQLGNASIPLLPHEVQAELVQAVGQLLEVVPGDGVVLREELFDRGPTLRRGPQDRSVFAPSQSSLAIWIRPPATVTMESKLIVATVTRFPVPLLSDASEDASSVAHNSASLWTSVIATGLTTALPARPDPPAAGLALSARVRRR